MNNDKINEFVKDLTYAEKYLSMYTVYEKYSIDKLTKNLKVNYDNKYKNLININSLYSWPDYPDKMTPLNWALLKGYLCIVKFLIEHCNAHVDIIFKEDGYYVSHCSSLYLILIMDPRNKDIIEYLITHKSDIHLGSEEKNISCLQLCCQHIQNNNNNNNDDDDDPYEKILEYMLKNDEITNVYKKNTNGLTIAHYIIYNRLFFVKKEIIRQILKRGYYFGMFTDIGHQISIHLPDDENKRCLLYCELANYIESGMVITSRLDKISKINGLELCLLNSSNNDNKKLYLNTIRNWRKECGVNNKIIMDTYDASHPHHFNLECILQEREADDDDNNSLIQDVFICERSSLSSTKYNYSHLLIKCILRLINDVETQDIYFYLLKHICHLNKHNAKYTVKIIWIIYENEMNHDYLFRELTSQLEQNGGFRHVNDDEYDFIIYLYLKLLHNFITSRYISSSDFQQLKNRVSILAKRLTMRKGEKHSLVQRVEMLKNYPHYYLEKYQDYLKEENDYGDDDDEYLRKKILNLSSPLLTSSNCAMILQFFIKSCRVNKNLLDNVNKNF